MTQYPFSATIPDTPHRFTDPFIEIILAVCTRYHVSTAELRSKCRTQPLATARHWAMYFLSKDGRYTLQFIADYFGGRNHTTICHARDRIAELIQVDDTYKEMHRVLGAEITSKF